MLILCLISLDPNAAFDTMNTIGHSTLLNRLQSSFIVTRSAISWLSTYLINCTQINRLSSFSSEDQKSHFLIKVPQGSVNPLFFPYTRHLLPLSLLLKCLSATVCWWCTTVYYHLLNLPTSCYLHSWFFDNGLAVNPGFKSDALIFGTCCFISYATQ